MITTHFRQAWQLIRQNKLFSTIYIVGTALAIAATTIFAIAYYIRIAPVYPEYQRDRMAHIFLVLEKSGPFPLQMGMSVNALNKYIYNLKSADLVSASLLFGSVSVDFDDDRAPIKAATRYTDPAFFKMYAYEFIDGAPFSQTDFESSATKAAISDLMAEQIFGTTEGLIGKTVSLNFNDYTICGVFREASMLNNNSYAQFIVPYTSFPDCSVSYGTEFCGPMRVVLLTDDPTAAKAELSDIARRYMSEHEGVTVDFFNQPRSNTEFALTRSFSFEEVDWSSLLRKNALILLVLLIVPALNLSGMIAGRMDSRRSEIGVRKSFGARRGRLLSQVLWENLILTVIGGILGLIVAWSFTSSADWMLDSISGNELSAKISADMSRVTPDMLFAPSVFGCAFLFCIILNVISALIPAWHSLRKPIVNSLK